MNHSDSCQFFRMHHLPQVRMPSEKDDSDKRSDRHRRDRSRDRRRRSRERCNDRRGRSETSDCRDRGRRRGESDSTGSIVSHAHSCCECWHAGSCG